MMVLLESVLNEPSPKEEPNLIKVPQKNWRDEIGDEEDEGAQRHIFTLRLL